MVTVQENNLPRNYVTYVLVLLARLAATSYSLSLIFVATRIVLFTALIKSLVC